MGIDHRAALSESEPSTVRQKNWLAEPCVKFVFIDLSSHACMSTLAIAISVACGHSPLPTISLAGGHSPALNNCQNSFAHIFAPKLLLLKQTRVHARERG